MEKPKKEYVMVGISPEIHQKLKVQCAQERRTIKAVLEKLIEDYLEDTAGKSQKVESFDTD